MEWISVKDKLPDENVWVLAFGEHSLPFTNGYTIQSWMQFTNHNDEWFKESFTHWMPLPEPPKA